MPRAKKHIAASRRNGACASNKGLSKSTMKVLTMNAMASTSSWRSSARSFQRATSSTRASTPCDDDDFST
eukprot:5082516-Prymnesium_polylepis.1